MAVSPEMLSGQFEFPIYENGSYCIYRYRYKKKPEGETRRSFVARGNDLPKLKNVTVNLYGEWVFKGKDKSFKVIRSEVKAPTQKNEVISYLTSLRCGIGKKKAEEIYDTFGESIWDVIKDQPEQLAKCGLGPVTSMKIAQVLNEGQTLAKVMQFFQGTPITAAKAKKLIQIYGSDTIHILTDKPYTLCGVEGFSFATLDSIALSHGLDPANIGRRIAAAIAALNSAAIEGNVCLPRDELASKMYRLLNANSTKAVSKELCDAAITYGIHNRELAGTSRYIYTVGRYQEEKRIATDLFRIMGCQQPPISDAQITQVLQEYEASYNLILDEQQRKAVACVMQHQITVLTGGPGTGKTTTIKAILYCFKKLFAQKDEQLQATLLSPTGKAARRMSESTGYPASTIHSGLRLSVGENETYSSDDPLPDGIILVDEFSMADLHVAYELARRIPSGSKVVFMGDPEQLPSVGCGNVLSELIRSQTIPTIKLSVIFRQAEGNPIVENSIRVRQGRTDLLRAPSFSLMEINDPEKAFHRAVNMYVQCVRKYGLDNTVLLCPYRKSTELNVNRFNFALQKILNPQKPDGLHMSGPSVFVDERSKTIEFREGDKVMMTVNRDCAKNGDVGYIKAIRKCINKDDPTHFTYTAYVIFNGDESNEVQFNPETIKDLDLAYCTTVHKSQGSEYQNVIMVMSSLHSRMLKRNLFYTGITRAKENVLLIGDKEAIDTAITNVDDGKRYTLLADRLHALQIKKSAA